MPIGSHALAPETIAKHIFVVRGHKVMLDADLAGLYDVQTKVLVQAVKRNQIRFPSDFMFQLTRQDVTNLKSQFVTSSLGDRRTWGGRRKAVNAFTEQGVAMLSSVLRSPRAIATNIAIMRTFVQLRQLAIANTQLSKKLDELEHRVSGHDETIKTIIAAIRDLAAPSAPEPKRRIGFVTQD
jgi:hypothetical protein